jgi:hypothetical protein
MTVYNFLLESERAKKTPILYTSTTSRYWWFPILQRHKPPYEIEQDHIHFTHNKTCYWDDIRYEALPSIHLADIDALLHLAATCRLLRPEVLALTWSNADISVSSSNPSKALHCNFYNVLSSDACSFVRTLQLMNYSSAPAREMSKIIKLIRRRLPQLDQLVIHIPHNSGTLSYETKDFGADLRAAQVVLRDLPLGITVRFHYFLTGKRNRYWQNQLRFYNETLDERFYILRTQGDAVTRARRHVPKMRQQKDQIADVLEATVELRSLSML